MQSEISLLLANASYFFPTNVSLHQDNNNTPPTWESDKASPSIAKISVGVPVATASTSTNSPGDPKGCDDDDDDRAHVVSHMLWCKVRSV